LTDKQEHDWDQPDLAQTFGGGLYAGWTRWFCLASAVASVAVLGALLYYAQPTGDDFCNAGSSGDLWTRVARYYSHATGRWAAIGVNLLVVGWMNLFRDYAGVLGGLCLLRLPAAYALTRTVVAADVPRKRCWLIAGSFCLLCWCAMPSIGDSMFWLAGAIFYELNATVMMLFLAALWSKELTLLRTCGLTAAAIILTGWHEIAGCALLVVVLAGCALRFQDRRRDRGWWVVLAAAAAGGLLLAALSPGNLARAQMHSAGPFRSIAVGGIHLVDWTLRWWMDAPVLLACGVLLLDPNLRLREEWTGWARARRRAVVPAAGGLTLVIGFFAAGWGLNGALPGRLLNWLYLVFLMTLFGTLLAWKPAWKWTARAPAGILRMARSLALAGMFVAMWAAGNPWLGAADLASRVPRWSAARLEALKRLQSGGGSGGAAVVTALHPTPHMYFDYDIVTDVTDYPNRCVAHYYGWQSVAGQDPGESPRGAALSGRSFGLRGGRH
jgi:uncharacterized protein DUF6056